MAEKGNTMAKVGSWAFIIGVVLALVGGIIANMLGASGPAVVTSILILMGLVVGFLNVTENETKEYLLAAVALVLISSLGGDALGNIMYIGDYIKNALGGIITFVMPATIVVALKAIYALAQDA